MARPRSLEVTTYAIAVSEGISLSQTLRWVSLQQTKLVGEHAIRTASEDVSGDRNFVVVSTKRAMP